MEKEYWDILDSNRNITGRTIQRGRALANGEYHLIVHVWIRVSENKYVISKRTNDRKIFPGQWECTGGSAIAGDDSLKTALKETKEELGIDLKPKNGRIIHQYNGTNEFSPNFVDVWLFEQEVKIEDIICQETEVEDARIVSKEEIEELIKTKEFVPGFNVYLPKVFESKVGGEF
jgi:8-oxo-dGTP pyrophosphatase MutT (NUDIX family)